MDNILNSLDEIKCAANVKGLKSYQSKRHHIYICNAYAGGSWVVFRGCAAAASNFSVGVSAHPSVYNESRFGGSEEALATAIRCPQLVLTAGNDRDNLKPSGKIIDILRCNADDGRGVTTEAKEYKDMAHGWVTRGNLSNPTVARDESNALERCLDFIDTHLYGRAGYDAF